MVTWDPTNAKAQFRLTAQRLGQLLHRKDAQGQVTGRDISILLQQGNETLARAKAQRLIQDEVMGGLLESLGNHVGVLLQHFSDLESGNLSPVVVEAASSVIFAAPHVDFKDLLTCRELLGIRLGSHFLHTASTNKDQCVSPQVVRALSTPPVSAAEMQTYLAGIASSYNVQWAPEYRPSDLLGALSGLLDRSSDTPAVDMSQLSKLCAYGIPDSPAWLRPRIWRLLLGTLPPVKSLWESEAQKHRESYYELVRRLLEPFSDLPPPTLPPTPLDAALTSSIKDLFRVPATLFSGLDEEPESFDDCPLNPSADEKIKIPCSANLDLRLEAIGRDDGDSQGLPEIRLGDEADDGPEISVISPGAHKTLFPSRSFNTGNVHPKHASALIRLLYIHSCLNPANHSPHMASLLIPLYSVLHQEVEPSDAAHVEADTFWLFETMVAEFAELEDEEGGNEWMRRFRGRLEWADPELSADLSLKGLDPGLPHYSYRWLAPLLTHTLPLPSVLSVWDSLFACPMTTRTLSPKLEALVDICASMLIRVRGPLFRLGKTTRHAPSLWAEENLLQGPPSPLRAWELNDAFIEGMSLLQAYPLVSAGGIDSILQTAVELRRRREEELKAMNVTTTLGSRLRDTLWKGFSSQNTSSSTSPEMSESEESRDDGDETETPSIEVSSSAPSLTSRWANAVWQGITNQSAMEVPASPVSPLPSSSVSPLRPSSPVSPLPPPSPVAPLPPPSPSSPLPPTPTSPKSPASSTSATSSSWWNYAEKIRDSDTAASLSKVGTNWRVKALQAWSKTSAPSTPVASDSPQSLVGRRADSSDRRSSEGAVNTHHERSFSNTSQSRSETYSPPPRPSYFRPPRDSMLPQPRKDVLPAPTPPESGDDTPSTQANVIRDSIASLAELMSPTPSRPSPRSAPKPLLLNSSTLLTRSTPSPHLKGDSLSSITPPASAVAMKTRRPGSQSEWESDTLTSRIVPLNRRSISPMAPQFHTGNGRPQSSSSEKGANGQDLFLGRGFNSPSGLSDGSASRGWSRADRLDSPATLPASPPLTTPPPPLAALSRAAVSGTSSQHASMVISEPAVRVLEAPIQAKKLVRKKTPPPSRRDYTSDSSAAHDAPPLPSPRMRQRRIAQHLTTIPTQAAGSMEDSITSPSTLTLPEFLDNHDNTVTPRASAFYDFNEQDSTSSASPVFPTLPPIRTRKGSGDGRKVHVDASEPRPRKISNRSHSPRPRKVSDSKSVKRIESGAEEGDDEGYDELLSAYESEDSGAHHVQH